MRSLQSDVLAYVRENKSVTEKQVSHATRTNIWVVRDALSQLMLNNRITKEWAGLEWKYRVL